MNRFPAVILLLVIACVWVPSVIAAEPATRPAGRFDDQPVVATPAAASAASGPETPSPRAADVAVPAARFDWPRVALALGTVIGLIIVLKLAGKKWFSLGGATGAGRLVRVLGRCAIAPRQQILVLQVGKRIIIAADNGGQMSSLCQISDADEVAWMLGQMQETDAATPAAGFKKWFSRASDDFDAEDEQETLQPAGVSGRVLSQDRASMDVPQQAMEDPSLQNARGEIANLMEKVRGIAGRLKR